MSRVPQSILVTRCRSFETILARFISTPVSGSRSNKSSNSNVTTVNVFAIDGDVPRFCCCDLSFLSFLYCVSVSEPVTNESLCAHFPSLSSAPRVPKSHDAAIFSTKRLDLDPWDKSCNRLHETSPDRTCQLPPLTHK